MAKDMIRELALTRVNKLELQRDTLAHALRELLKAEKLDDDDPILGEARCRATKALEYASDS